MTSNGRRGPRYRYCVQRLAAGRPLGLSLCAVLLAGSAGCMASPEYPIHAGEAAGDGALHMTQHPQYPIDPASATASPPPAAPVQSPPPPAEDDDAPHALPRSTVESNDLPPPGASAPAPQATPPQTLSLAKSARFDRAVALDRSSLLEATLRFGVISDDGRPTAAGGAAGFDQIALHHHRRKAAAKGEAAKGDTGKAETGKSEGGKSEPAGKARRGRRGKHSETAEASASRSGRRHAHLRAPLGATALADAPASEIETPYQTAVKPGERAADVAARLHVSKQALMSLNDIKPTSKLRPGEVLKVPYRLAYTVGQGDTLFAISHRFGLDLDQVAKLNGLKHAAALHLGQAIALPLTAEDAGPRGHADGPAPKPEAAPAKLVEAELTKARSAAARRAVREQALARETPAAPTAAAPTAASQVATSDADNGVRMAAELNERELASRTAAPPSPASPPSPTAPSAATGYSVANEMAADRPSSSPWSTPTPAASSTPTESAPSAPGRVATLNAPGPSAYGTRSAAQPGYTGPVLGRVRPAAPTGASGPVSDADVSTAGRGRFVWPLRGVILTPFGDRGPGQRNDGLDISASPGESVRAAASGEVVYAGSSIPGFGNLVLVKHPGGWVTAYAHLDRIEVRMRDEVSQGEEIGQAGQTGAVDRPELHFEIRYAPDPTGSARPVDPTLVLPGAG